MLGAQALDLGAGQARVLEHANLLAHEVERLRTEHSIYAVDTGRICVAALNSKNIDRVIDAIAKVL